MTSLQIGVYPTPDAVSDAVANRMAGLILRELSQEQFAHVCLTGGRGGRGAMASLAQVPGIDWQRVHMWWSDERFEPSGSDLRNDTEAHQVLLDVVGHPVNNIHAMGSSDQFATVDDAAQAYVEELSAFGDPCPAFCVGILGMGEDGHVASLFPEHRGLREKRPAFSVTDSPKPPPVRVSMSFDSINAAQENLIIASGEGKADAVGLFINDPGPLAVPAAGVHGRTATFLAVDEAAAVHLPPGMKRFS